MLRTGSVTKLALVAVHPTHLTVTAVLQKSADDANQFMALLGRDRMIFSSWVQLFITSAACRHVCSSTPTQQQIARNSHRATSSRKANCYPVAFIVDLATGSLW